MEESGQGKGKRRAGGIEYIGQATEVYNAGQTLDEQTTRKLKTKAVEVSEGPRRKR